MPPKFSKPPIIPTTPPTFVPRSLYIGLLKTPAKGTSSKPEPKPEQQRNIPIPSALDSGVKHIVIRLNDDDDDTNSGDRSTETEAAARRRPPSSSKHLVLFYTEVLDVRSLDHRPLEGDFWYLAENEPGVFTPIKGSMQVEKALNMEQVIGYVRIASVIPRPQAMKTLIEEGDHRVNSTEGMNSEVYVYHAVERLRKWGIVRGYFFDYQTFKREIDRVGDEWIKSGRGEEEPTPLADFRFCDLW